MTKLNFWKLVKICGIFILVSIGIGISIISMCLMFKKTFILGRDAINTKQNIKTFTNSHKMYLSLRYIITPLCIILLSIIFFEFFLNEKLPKGKRIPQNEYNEQENNEYIELQSEIII